MSLRRKRRFTAVLALFLCAAPAALAGIDWEAKGSEIVSEIIANPSAFFYDFQQDLEATTPVLPGKTMGFQVGLFPSAVPMGYGNLSGKLRLHPEGRLYPGLPQLDVYGGYWQMMWAQMAVNQSDDINDARFYGHYMGLMLASSVSPRVRVFGGWKYASLTANLDMKKAVDIMGTEVSSFHSNLNDNFLVAGIECPTGLDNWWTMQFNYGLTQEILAAKVSWYGKYFELGFNIYPEGVLVIHPVWNFHVNF
ncbi:MAG: hypothetical protein PHW69_07320 [Elusimicrobiaceae bacterium]|nr:hypothetical protein [Elusimicrobiaceae bacterium]